MGIKSKCKYQIRWICGDDGRQLTTDCHTLESARAMARDGHAHGVKADMQVYRGIYEPATWIETIHYGEGTPR